MECFVQYYNNKEGVITVSCDNDSMMDMAFSEWGYPTSRHPHFDLIMAIRKKIKKTLYNGSLSR